MERDSPPENPYRPPFEWPLAWQYALALGLMAATLAARWLLDDMLEKAPFILFYTTLFPLALLVRPGPFLMAAGIGFIGAFLMFIGPLETMAIDEDDDAFVLAIFALTLCSAALTAWLAYRARERRARDQAALAASERRLRLVTNAVPALIAYVDADERYRFNNETYRTWFNQTPAALQGRRLQDVLGEPAFAAIEPHVRAALFGQPISYEADMPYQHGGTRFIQANYVPDLEPDGSVAGYFALVTDISDRRRMEEELRRRNEQFEALIATVPMAIYLVDADLRIRHVNAIAHSTLGEGFPGGIEGRDVGTVLRRIWPQDFADEIVGIFRHTLETGEPYYGPERAEVRADSGLVEYYEAYVFRIALPEGEYGAVCYFRDVSDQAHARQAIARSEARYRALFESMDEGFCILEMIFDAGGQVVDYRYVETNPAFVRQSGLEDATGKTLRELLPDVESFWFDVYGNVARTGEPARFIDHSPAVDRWFDVDAFRIGCPEERRVAVLFNDITERKRAEQALREADRRKDEFLATIAHELRNPLAAIRMAMNVLNTSSDTPQHFTELTAIIDRQSAQLVRLINDLLDVGRIARGTMKLARSRVDASRIVLEVLCDSHAACEERGLTASWDLPEDPVWIDADALRMAQVVGNLVQNACQFTPAGGKIHATVEQKDEVAVIRVADTGIGLAPEQIGRIFDMFTQAEHSGKWHIGGLGIGLSLARSIIEMHGGTIGARSGGPGAGSEFVVTLPVAAGAPSAEDDGERLTADERAAPPAVKRIVIADDNPDVLQAVALMLRLKGFTVVTAINGTDAVEKVRATRPDVALLDIGMPEMDGYEVARRIRQEPWAKGLLLVALTGWGRDRDRQQAADAGFDTHLTKPVDIDVLERLILEGRPEQALLPG
jgi:PAS domain S-box-containing protein